MNNNYIKVKIEGKNVNNYIKWLISKKINILKLDIIKHNELNLIIDYHDYNLLKKYSKTYKVTIIKKYGKLRLFDMIKKNSIILSCLILSIFFLYFLSHIIFSVDIVYNNQEIVKTLTKELEKYNIKKYRLKKDYDYLEKVKKQILEDNKDTLEWVEIVEDGTKYIIKVVERKKEQSTKEYEYQSIVASKDAVLTSIKAYSGEKAKIINEYVKANDVIISGILTKPDGSNLYTKATGQIYGEVWYKINVEYPLFYQEEKVTGKNKNFLVLYFMNFKIPIFPYKMYKQFKSDSKVLIENNLLPIKIVKENQYEVILKEEIYTKEEAINKAIDLAKKKLQESNEKIIEIKEISVLTENNYNSKISLTLFASVIEDITKIIEIKPNEIEIKPTRIP